MELDTADAAPVSRALRTVASVAAPTSLLTALLFYFGWSHAFYFFDYFGVNSTVLGLSTQDYLMRSVDGLFVPVTAAASLGLVLLWIRRLLPERWTSGVRWLVRIP